VTLDKLIKKKENVWDEEFTKYVAFLYGTTIFDVESNFAAVGNGAREGHPIVKLFVDEGRIATYGFLGTLNGGLTYFAYKKKEEKKSWKEILYIPALFHVVAGSFNLRFVF